jgi:[acyl-carrier-protein] S-malonyltransferase
VSVSYAVIFPGQGAAAPGAGQVWRAHDAWATIDEAEAILDRPIGRLLLDADADELATTRASQLAVLATSLLAWDLMAPQLAERPVAFAGHSLGQVTALVAAGALDRADGLRLAARRADLSQDSADHHGGRMAALVGCDLDVAEKACATVRSQDLGAWVANDNAPGQVVIAGTPEGLAAAGDEARALGARRVMPLAVGHAFHTPLLADAADGLAPLLDELAFRAPEAPIVDNTDAAAVTDPAVWPALLRRHLVEPVRWVACQRRLADLGDTSIDTLVEIGPGRVLAGMARRTLPGVRVLNVATPEEAHDALLQLDPTSAATPAAGADTSPPSPTPSPVPPEAP